APSMVWPEEPAAQEAERRQRSEKPRDSVPAPLPEAEVERNRVVVPEAAAQNLSRAVAAACCKVATAPPITAAVVVVAADISAVAVAARAVVPPAVAVAD